MKIESLEVENFKLFSDNFNKIKNISDSNLVLLNGPNGYGKTTIFDAIEFALTGKIKRIQSYTNSLGIPKSGTYETKILISDPNKEAFVKLKLKENDEIIELERMYTPENNKIRTQDNNPNSIFEHFKSKIFINGVEIIDDNEKAEFLKDHKLDNINDFYDKCCFLSQDESLAFLKENKKEKADGLDFLFNIEEKHSKEIERVDAILNRLKNKNTKSSLGLTKKISDEIERITTSIKEEENKIFNVKNNQNVKYECLFPEKNIYWDSEILNFEISELEEVSKDIERLLYFKTHQEECINYLFNKPYKALIQDFNGFNNLNYTKNKLAYAYKNYSLLLDSEKYKREYQLKENYKKLKDCIVDKELNEINWDFVLEEKLLQKETIEEIKNNLSNINTITLTLNTTNKAILEINNARSLLSERTKEPIEKNIISDNCCVFCGKAFYNKDLLITSIKNQENNLKALCDISSRQVSEIFEGIYTKHLNNILDKITIKMDNLISDEFYKNFIEVVGNDSKIIAINTVLNKIELQLPKVYNEDEENLIKGYEDLVNMVKSNIKNIDEDVELQIKELQFDEKYNLFYNKDEIKFRAVTEDMLKSKLEYVKSNLYNNSLKAIAIKKNELVVMKKRKTKLDSIYSEIQSYYDVISGEVINYKQKIISDIEPMVFVYTAKILQQKFNGKSIFISTDNKFKNISLINSLKDKQDILYSMSSGQLSAVSIAFLLCMNQIYAQNQSLPILLIDDPIQTIDDVNMVGLVDILRFEFPNTQLFISTHEQKFEWYLRYKFEKAEKEVKLFNMKEIVLTKD